VIAPPDTLIGRQAMRIIPDGRFSGSVSVM
jgi:hypothetical protein